MRDLVEILWKVPMDNANLMPKCASISLQIQENTSGLEGQASIVYTNGWYLALYAPSN